MTSAYNFDEILQQFDACAREYTFPMLDNGYVYLGTVRLTAYRDPERWALVIEVVGYSPRAGGFDGFDNALHLFGNCLKRAPGTANEDFLHPVSEGPDGPTFEDECSEVVLPEARSLTLRDQVVPLHLAPDALAAKGIELVAPPEIRGADLLRSLLPEHRELLLATEEELRARIPADLPQILRLDEWHHPDLASDELPSQSETFRMIADVLVTGDASRYRPTADPNTDWRNWPEGGTL